MNSKIYKQVEQKIINNIEIIYNNKEIAQELRKVYNQYPSLEVLKEDALMSGALTGSTAYIDGVGNIDIDPAESLNEFIDLMLHGSTVSNFYDEEYQYKEEADLLRKIVSNKKDNPFINICKKLKLNHSIWKNVVVAKFLEIPQKTVLKFMDNIIQFQYLPKVKLSDEKILLEINELTTIEEIKLIWNDIKIAQKEFEKQHNFINQKRKYQTLERGRKVDKLGNIKNKEVSKMLNKDINDSNKVIGYEYVSKIKKAYKKKFMER